MNYLRSVEKTYPPQGSNETRSRSQWESRSRLRPCLVCLPLCCERKTSHGSVHLMRARASNGSSGDFAGVCASCHGLDGRGGERGPDIVTQPDVARKTDAELIKIVRDGKTAAGMPSFASQGAARLSALVAYLRVLQGSNKQSASSGRRCAGKSTVSWRSPMLRVSYGQRTGGFYGSDLTVYAQRISADEVRAVIVDRTRISIRVTEWSPCLWPIRLRSSGGAQSGQFFVAAPDSGWSVSSHKQVGYTQSKLRRQIGECF